jgi:spore germination cell wall hydrolase CwlJ-like protein
MSSVTCFATSDSDVNTNVNDNPNSEVTVQTVENSNEETQTSIIKKLDFEYELQGVVDTYKDVKQAEKNQTKAERIEYMESVVASEEYTIDEKRDIVNDEISNAILDSLLQPSEGLSLKQSFSEELNRQVDVNNLNLTMENILNSTATVESKKSFCLNALELSKLSGTISEDEYNDRLSEVEVTLSQQKVEEQQQTQLAEEQKAKREEVLKLQAEEEAKQKSLQAKAEANTTDKSVDVDSLQTIAQAKDVDDYANTNVTTTPTEDTQVQDTTQTEEVAVQETVDTTPTAVGFNGSFTYTEQDFLALVNVVQHEVGYCSTLSKKMVASVIINRVLSQSFPSTIYDVVNQDNQFTGMSAYINRTDYASEDTIKWCQYVLDNGIDYSNGALFYYAPQWCGYMSYFENMTLVAELDGQRYFK